MTNLKRKIKRKKLKEYYSSQKSVDSEKKREISDLFQEALRIEKILKQKPLPENVDEKQLRKYSVKLKDIKKEINVLVNDLSFTKDFPDFNSFNKEFKNSGLSLEEIKSDD